VAVAVTVLAGALLVGDSVRGSLRDLVLQRLGNTELAVVSPEFFRAQLADDLRADPTFANDVGQVAALVAVDGIVIDQASSRRASRVSVYGVDDRFWAFHGASRTGPSGREAFVSPALAREIGAENGNTVLVRVQRPSAIPLESLHGRKEDVGRTLRLQVAAVLPASELGEFSLQPQQGNVRAVFVPLARLQQEIELPGRVNVMLFSGQARQVRQVGERLRPTSALEALIRKHAALEDIGLTLRTLDAQGVLSLESQGSLIDAPREEAAMAAAEAIGERRPVLTYLVNDIRIGDRAIPYSLVTAIELETIVPGFRRTETGLPPIVLNDWAARDLNAKVGERVTLEYYVWEDPGRLVTRTSPFVLAAIVPMAGAAADRDLAPDYPGISGSQTLSDWDPPFPIDLKRVRPVDEDYWNTRRTTPKAFIPELDGRVLWRSRYGELTSIRVLPRAGTSLPAARDAFASALRAELDPVATSLAVRPVRAEGLAASRGATDFGEYFTYFSFFLVVSAVLLAALFFKLGVEQRGREVGVLRAVGFSTPTVRRLFVAEGLVLASVGSVAGMAGALLYGELMMTGLRTWWVDAVGTTALVLHVSPVSLAFGALGGIAAAVTCIWWTLRSLSRISERSLLAGQVSLDPTTLEQTDRRIQPGWLAAGLLALGVALVAAGAVGVLGRTGAFFGAGAALLGAALGAVATWLRRPPASTLAGHGWWPIVRIGARNASFRPARSVLSIAVVSFAAFILISVDVFKRDGQADASDPTSGTGGYALLVDTVLPVVQDPNSSEGRELFGVQNNVTIAPFRVRPGDDTSCLNLYAPTQPRIIAPRTDFVAAGRFRFGSVLDRADDAEQANPWLLLNRDNLAGPDDPATIVPVIGDANSMTYVLHKQVGEDVVIALGSGEVRLRLVAALSDSLLQGELVMSEANFIRLFPNEEGYRFFLLETPADQVNAVATAVEDRLSDFGADAKSTVERIAEFHRVENTYLSTFQTLGGLGLLLGTVGFSAVLLRNVLERRRELALLTAIGYGRGRLFGIVLSESLLLLGFGLAVGVACALIAIAPAALDRGGALPTGTSTWTLLAAIFATGAIASVLATRTAMRTHLLGALRAE
jgi:ABC-type lipoprotein release transport system permease subunit